MQMLPRARSKGRPTLETQWPAVGLSRVTKTLVFAEAKVSLSHPGQGEVPIHL